MKSYYIKANVVDVKERRIYPAEVSVAHGRIERISELNKEQDSFLIPGFIDAHIHIESSMVTPVEFAKAAVAHGTVATVSDPHEIANVLGTEGVEYMIQNAEQTSLKILFGAPSCVPATSFESSGAIITAREIEDMLRQGKVGYLSEMMNYPGVIFGDIEVKRKLAVAKEANVPVDGHAPGVMGEELKVYADAGISTDHECFTLEEAREKIRRGMKIQIREGSGAKNFETLLPLLNESPEMVMFCSDDLHPDDLLKGHINLLVKRAIEKGYDLFDVLRAAGYNAKKHYKLDVGMLQVGDPSDFIQVDSLENFKIEQVWIDGSSVFKNGTVTMPEIKAELVNRFDARKINIEDIGVESRGSKLKVIRAIDGELITKSFLSGFLEKQGMVQSDCDNDILKLVVVNRYVPSDPAVAFINGFGLKEGAIASSIAHDSHNIICVGTSDSLIMETINWIIDHKGGIVAYDGERFTGLDLPVAGILTDNSVAYAAEMYKRASEMAGELGSQLTAPFMTLAFMSLLVIPELKLSDKGLFDGVRFEFTPLFE